MDKWMYVWIHKEILLSNTYHIVLIVSYTHVMVSYINSYLVGYQLSGSDSNLVSTIQDSLLLLAGIVPLSEGEVILAGALLLISNQPY